MGAGVHAAGQHGCRRLCVGRSIKAHGQNRNRCARCEISPGEAAELRLMRTAVNIICWCYLRCQDYVVLRVDVNNGRVPTASTEAAQAPVPLGAVTECSFDLLANESDQVVCTELRFCGFRKPIALRAGGSDNGAASRSVYCLKGMTAGLCSDFMHEWSSSHHTVSWQLPSTEPPPSVQAGAP